MPVAKLVAIDSIETSRQLNPGDDISALMQSINDEGLQVPILIDMENNLIDGLRRLEATRKLGQTQIQAVSTFLYPKACEAIKEAREHGKHAAPLTGQRIWEIYEAMLVLMRKTLAHYRLGRARGLPSRHRTGGGHLLARALGVSSEDRIRKISKFYRMLNDKDPAIRKKAGEALVMIEKGLLTYHGGLELVLKPQGLSGDIKSAPDQAKALEASALAISSATRVLSRLGPLHKNLSREDAERNLAELRKARGEMSKILKLLTKELNLDK